MKYTSTRDADVEVSSSAAIVSGPSKEGGLFVPAEIPKITPDDLSPLSSYKDMAALIIGSYLTDFTKDEIERCVANAYNKEKFETESVAPLYKLTDGTYLLELWHGPTSAFKDMALQLLPHLMVASAKKQGIDEKIVILAATSGDTGKAALEGFSGVSGTKVIVYYPEHGVSQMQRIQMITTAGDNVSVVGVEGNFDDAQKGVKEIFADGAFLKKLKSGGVVLSSANSINWGRLVSQIVYYYWAYMDLLKNEEITDGEKINFVVPTGNFGNILAAYYAMRMGLPVNRLICASNRNNVLTDFFENGNYDKNRQFFVTMSPSMDILVSGNLERYLFHATGGDAVRTLKWMRELGGGGGYKVSDEVMADSAGRFWAGYCDDYFTAQYIGGVWNKYHYCMDPHTAVAGDVYKQYVNKTGDNTKTVIASTASPYKFCFSVLESMGCDTYGKDDIQLINMLENVSGMKIPRSIINALENRVRFTGTCKKDDLKSPLNRLIEGNM